VSLNPSRKIFWHVAFATAFTVLAVLASAARADSPTLTEGREAVRPQSATGASLQAPTRDGRISGSIGGSGQGELS
jgi:hypothetical protein